MQNSRNKHIHLEDLILLKGVHTEYLIHFQFLHMFFFLSIYTLLLSLIHLFRSLLLKPFTQSLETLNLGHNAVGNEGVHKLKDGLVANRSILRLGLASTKLSCEGEIWSANVKLHKSTVNLLHLRWMTVNSRGQLVLSMCEREDDRCACSHDRSGRYSRVHRGESEAPPVRHAGE